MKKILFVFLSWLFYIQSGSAQESVHKDSSDGLSLTGKTGTIFSPAEHQPTGTVYGAEIGYQINMSRNTADWIHILHVRDVSLNASYLTLRNVSLVGLQNSKGIMGDLCGINAQLDMAICHIDATTILFCPGIGVVYSTQTFQTNQNPIVGSHINFTLQAGLAIETPLSHYLKLVLRADAEHISNAYVQSPNAGINAVTASVGLIKIINDQRPSKGGESFDGNNKSSVEFDIGVGRRDFTRTGYFINNPPGKKFISYDGQKAEGTSDLYNIGMYVGYDYRLNSVFSLKAGSTAMYYSKTFSAEDFFKTYEGPITSYTHLTVGISAGAGLSLGRLVFSANYGRYVRSNFLDPAVKSYWTFGPKYYMTSRVALMAKVYFHGSESSYANFGLAFSF